MTALAKSRIILNLPEIAALVRQQPIDLKIGNQPIEISLQPGISPTVLIGLMIDLLGGGKFYDYLCDPPEAVEFLRQKRPRKY